MWEIQENHRSHHDALPDTRMTPSACGREDDYDGWSGSGRVARWGSGSSAFRLHCVSRKRHLHQNEKEAFGAVGNTQDGKLVVGNTQDGVVGNTQGRKLVGGNAQGKKLVVRNTPDGQLVVGKTQDSEHVGGNTQDRKLLLSHW